mmetsp:Transcript_40701/g.46814  ORF Transcript_40701/g.46814 Transcript_40701/m.46814 type:complete len:217 (+) Transcript_40701:230-880(+)
MVKLTIRVMVATIVEIPLLLVVTARATTSRETFSSTLTTWTRQLILMLEPTMSSGEVFPIVLPGMSALPSAIIHSDRMASATPIATCPNVTSIVWTTLAMVSLAEIVQLVLMIPFSAKTNAPPVALKSGSAIAIVMSHATLKPAVSMVTIVRTQTARLVLKVSKTETGVKINSWPMKHSAAVNAFPDAPFRGLVITFVTLHVSFPSVISMPPSIPL